MLSRFVRELDDGQRPAEHWTLAKLVNGGDVWTLRDDRLQDLVELIVVVVFELEPAVQRGRPADAGQQKGQTGDK